MAELRITAHGLEVRATAQEVADARYTVRLIAGKLVDEELPEMGVLANLLEYHLCNGWTLCEADDLGALSQAPVLSPDITVNDAGCLELATQDARLFFFEPYQVRSVVDEIVRKGVAVFQEVR